MQASKEIEMDYDVKDLTLARKGKLRIEWAGRFMPVLAHIKRRFAKDKPLKGVKLSACLHVTSETANLMETLKLGGATVALTASNPLSTQDDVSAALVKHYKIPVFAIKGENNRTYYQHINQALDLDPDDEVVGAWSLSGDDRVPGHEMLIVTAAGYGIRRDVGQLPARSRPGDTTGKTLMQARDVLGVFGYRPGAQLVFATYGGKLAFAAPEDAARHDRLAKGSRLCDLDHDPAVAVAQIL